MFLRASVVAAMAVGALLAGLEQRAAAWPIRPQEWERQQQVFRRWWNAELIRRLSDLPTEGRVPEWRIPDSRHDFPDAAGGTNAPVGSHRVSALLKYDRAFHGGRPLVQQWEMAHCVGAHRQQEARGLFRLRTVDATPHWYGHCNGWVGAAIRHAEPQQNVVRNGVVFTPADIKTLLTELYMYSETEHLGGIDPAINPGTLHIIFANWLGRGQHPIAMEVAVGTPVFNYPAYAYEDRITMLGPRRAQVHKRVTYAMNSNYEHDQSPRIARQMNFHYTLDLDERGEIVGGAYLGGSSQIDMLWTQLAPRQGGQKGNERGCPHLNMHEVLSLWRESVPEELRRKWRNIDPLLEDVDPELARRQLLARRESGTPLTEAEEKFLQRLLAEAGERVDDDASAAAPTSPPDTTDEAAPSAPPPVEAAAGDPSETETATGDSPAVEASAAERPAPADENEEAGSAPAEAEHTVEPGGSLGSEGLMLDLTFPPSR